MGMPGQHSNIRSPKHNSKLTKEQVYSDERENIDYLNVASYSQHTHEVPEFHSYTAKSILVQFWSN